MSLDEEKDLKQVMIRKIKDKQVMIICNFSPLSQFPIPSMAPHPTLSPRERPIPHSLHPKADLRRVKIRQVTLKLVFPTNGALTSLVR